MWKGHFQPILLTGALDVTVIPMHNAWTQYSHVCFTLPRLQTCEYPTDIAFVSRLPSPHTLQRVESNSGEGPLCCLCFHRCLLLWRKRKEKEKVLICRHHPHGLPLPLLFPGDVNFPDMYIYLIKYSIQIYLTLIV